jgi:hypothetical protein
MVERRVDIARKGGRERPKEFGPHDAPHLPPAAGLAMLERRPREHATRNDDLCGDCLKSPSARWSSYGSICRILRGPSPSSADSDAWIPFRNRSPCLLFPLPRLRKIPLLRSSRSSRLRPPTPFACSSGSTGWRERSITQLTEDVGRMLTFELDRELLFGIEARTDQNEFGTLIIEKPPRQRAATPEVPLKPLRLLL